MKVYQDLVFRGDRESLDRLIAAIEGRLSDGWARSRDNEREIRRVTLGPMYCFSCTARGTRAASDLWIATKTKSSLYVANIVPKEHRSLTYDQYNQILREFHDRFARTAADSVGFQVELGNPEPQIEDFLSPSAARELRSFSSRANRSILHPLDRERWNQFLTRAHRERAPLTSDILKRWLIEEEKWPEDKAFDLIVEYENSRDLLKTYEAQQA